MSEEVTKQQKPIQDAMELVYTELGIVLDKRANNVDSWLQAFEWAHDIGRMCDALKRLSEVSHW